MQRHIINVAILWLALTFIGELLLQNAVLIPPGASQQAEVVDEAFRLLFALGLPVFTFGVSVLAYSLVNFRARQDSLEAGATIYGHNIFSLGWLGITGALCFLVIIHPGFTGLAKLFAMPREDDLVVKVTGSMWAWRVEYPAYGKSSREELLLPVGRRVRFEVTGTDVLHSFWIPAFRLKIDAVPGMVTTTYANPTEVGSHKTNPMLRIQCAELCGLNHATMMLPVRVVPQAEFDAWAGVAMAAPPPAATPKGLTGVERGKALADEQGCVACHSIDGSVRVGPTWLGLYGSQATLADGTTVEVNEDYLRESIIDPNAKIARGFPPNVMPATFGKTLTEDQIHDLVEYIESLGRK